MAKRRRQPPTEFTPFPGGGGGVSSLVPFEPRDRGGRLPNAINTTDPNFNNIPGIDFDAGGPLPFEQIQLPENPMFQDPGGFIPQLQGEIDQGMVGFDTENQSITDFFANLVARVDEQNPDNPFGQEQFDTTLAGLFSRINQETSASQQRSLVNFSSRGLGRGSGTFAAGQDIADRGTGARSQALISLLGLQTDVNTQAAQFKSSLLSDLGIRERRDLSDLFGRRTDFIADSRNELRDILAPLFEADISQTLTETAEADDKRDEDVESGFNSLMASAGAGARGQFPGPVGTIVVPEYLNQIFSPFNEEIFDFIEENPTKGPELEGLLSDIADLTASITRGEAPEGELERADLINQFFEMIGVL